MTGNDRILLLIDTGADISLFKRTKVNPSQIVDWSKACRIRGVTDECTYSIATTHTVVYFGNYAFSHTFHLVSEKFPIPVDGIIGRDFISNYLCKLDYENWTMTLRTENQKICVPIKNSLDDQYLVIPSRCEVNRYINKFESLKNDAVVLNDEIAPGVFIAGSIISSSNPIVRIVNTNFQDVKVNIEKIQTRDIKEYFIFTSSNDECANRNDTLLNILDHNIPEFAKTEVLNLCLEFSDIFCLKTDKITTNNFYEQKLNVTDRNPVYVKNYRTPHSQKAEINDQVKKMLENDIIEPSNGIYNSPVILVPRKSSSDQKKYRLVIDYRLVNKKLIPDKFPLNRIDDILDQLGRAKYFSVVDLISSFHQVGLHEDSRDITSFTVDAGSFRFKRLPFGLKVSPNSFMRMMSIAFSGLSPENAFLYMDDLIIIGCSKNHHLSNIRKVFEICRKYNLKLNPEKSKFFRCEVTYLGHKITDKGILPDESKYDIINKYPVPSNADEVKRFVAFCNYYRRFIPNFAEITSPLNKLTRKNCVFLWSEECQKAFEYLKKSLISPKILQYPDFNKPFILTTDASNRACAAVLSQNFDEGEMPICFASRSFTKGESNKSTIEKELSAIHWGIQYFKPYLYGNKFIVKSDHRPLAYLFSLKDPSSKLTRMRLDIESYDFEIQFLSGKENVVADALSRISIRDLVESSHKSAKIFATTRSMTRSKHYENKQKSSEPDSDITEPKMYENLDILGSIKIPALVFQIKQKYLRIIFERNRKVSAEKVIPIINGNISLENMLSELEKMADNHGINKLKLRKNDEIFKVCTQNELKEICQKVLRKISIVLIDVPKIITNKNEKQKLIETFHENPVSGGHSGQKRLLKKLRLKYRWKGMSRDVANFIKSCELCQFNKKKVKHVEPMVITPTPQSAFDITAIDTIGPFLRSSQGNSYAVTIQCELSKYIVVIPIPNKEARTVAKAIVEHFILIYGNMKEIRTDLGTEYKNQIFEELTKLLKIEHKTSTPYHSQTIGCCERNHRVLNEYLRMYINEFKTDWDEWIKYYCYCYNTTPSSYHNYAPFELVFGKKPDLSVSTNSIDPVYNIDLYYQEIRYRLQIAHNKCQKLIEKIKNERKSDYDKMASHIDLKKGDLIMISNENRSKLDPWYNGPFQVVSNDNVNCTVKNDKGQLFTVHKNRVQRFYK